VARGVRNTVGFDFDPKTGDLWFTNNGRDWLSEDLPNDTLNRVGNPGKDHFGYPFCHQGDFSDPEFGWGKKCSDYAQPAMLRGPHAGSLPRRQIERQSGGAAGLRTTTVPNARSRSARDGRRPRSSPCRPATPLAAAG